MSILVTGGAGYIGSHTVIDLVENGMQPVIADNLCNSKFEAVKRVRELAGRDIPFYEYDLCDIDKVRDIFEKEDIEAVIHFAGLKAVGESVAKPLEYFANNLGNTLNILRVMREHGVKNFVFSSSATVYGQPKTVPIKEDFPLSVTNPYGRTKLMIEDILRDVYAADHTMNIALLRYFNPIGAHKSGRIGEESAPAKATASSRSSALSRKPAAEKSPTSSTDAAPATSPSATPIPPLPKKSSVSSAVTA